MLLRELKNLRVTQQNSPGPVISNSASPRHSCRGSSQKESFVSTPLEGDNSTRGRMATIFPLHTSKPLSQSDRPGPRGLVRDPFICCCTCTTHSHHVTSSTNSEEIWGKGTEWPSAGAWPGSSPGLQLQVPVVVLLYMWRVIWPPGKAFWGWRAT